MPSCVKCSYVQAKLNKGDLCKSCFDLNAAHCSIDVDFNCQSDRSMVDIIKENMIQEKIWNDNIQTLLKDQIKFLKSELLWKNDLINNLVINRSKSKNDENLSTPPTERKVENSFNIKSSWDISPSNSDINENKSILQCNPAITAEIVDSPAFSPKWNLINTHGFLSRSQGNKDSNVIGTTNRFESLVVDECSIDDNDDNDDIRFTKCCSGNFPQNRRPQVVIDKFPERNVNPKLVPVNSSYASIAKKDRKILILADSIPSRIKMKEFNYWINNCHTIRKCFFGATPP